MASQFEEIVMDANRPYSQQLFPYGTQAPFAVVTGRDIGHRHFRAGMIRPNRKRVFASCFAGLCGDWGSIVLDRRANESCGISAYPVFPALKWICRKRQAVAIFVRIEAGPFDLYSCQP